ncbi:MAG: hypothetical protein Q7S17_05735 [Xanthobacteraceae bacterium]|nr:hypothetical protein [Xanthobacteraceae bacterium]
MTARDDIIAALDQYWRSAADVYKRVNCWAPTTISSQLDILARDEKIDREKRNLPQGFMWVYRLKASL